MIEKLFSYKKQTRNTINKINIYAFHDQQLKVFLVKGTKTPTG